MLLQACLNGSFRLVYHFECKRFGSKGKRFDSAINIKNNSCKVNAKDCSLIPVSTQVEMETSSNERKGFRSTCL